MVRPDRIGDVVLSTPVFTNIRRARPEWEITALVRPMMEELLQGHPDIDGVITLSTDEKPGFSNTRNLAENLGPKQFDAAIHLYSDFWISLAVWRAGVPLRVGPASKIAQIFYNTKVVQHRSKGNRHEAEYNLDLLTPLGIEPAWYPPSLVAANGLPHSADGVLDSAKKNVGVFPSMGGSARNWSPEKWAELATSLSGEGVNVILIGGPMDSEAVRKVERMAEGISPASPGVFISQNLKELTGFMKEIDCLVAPSTGPLHIASAVGTPAVGIYCPIRVCLPNRWGPKGEKDAAFMPEAPPCEKCTGEECQHFDCMDKIDPKRIIEAVMKRV